MLWVREGLCRAMIHSEEKDISLGISLPEIFITSTVPVFRVNELGSMNRCLRDSRRRQGELGREVIDYRLSRIERSTQQFPGVYMRQSSPWVLRWRKSKGRTSINDLLLNCRRSDNGDPSEGSVDRRALSWYQLTLLFVTV